MGYVIVPPEYIKGEGSNYHIFEASVSNYDTKYLEISNKSICNKVAFKEQYKSINSFYNYTIYINTVNNIRDIFEKSVDFQKSNSGIIYVSNIRNLKIVCALLKVDICGVCMSTIY